MPDFRPNLTAHRVHEQLRRSLAELHDAEKNAVLWFTEMLHRKLFRDLGYGSIQQYAAVELGFSRSKTSQFLRLSEGLKKLPQLKKAMARGEIGWTKAREIEKVATAKTERSWINEARQTSRRELEAKVRAARQRANSASKTNPAQLGLTAAIAVAPAADSPTRAVANAPAEVRTELRSEAPEEIPAEITTEIRLTLDPEQLARYEALMEILRKRGHRANRTNLVLAALESLVHEGRGGSEETKFTRVNAKSQIRDGSRGKNNARARARRGDSVRGPSRSSYQILVRQCPRCEEGTVHTSRGDQRLSPGAMAAILCDADVRKEGKPKRALVPPGLRREILTRDGHQCQSAGCKSRHLLHVHHRVKNGSNDSSNLITLCAACHGAIHRLERSQRKHPAGRRTARAPAAR